MPTTTAAMLRSQLLDSPTHRVIAVADTTGAARNLPVDRFTNLAEGRVGVLARPGMRRLSWLAADLLTVLGCRPDVAGAGRFGDGDWSQVAAWLNAHHIQHLYLAYAWTMPLPILQQVAQLTDRTPCTVWLVGDTPFTDNHAATLQPWTAHTITGETFTAAWTDLTPTPTPPAQPAPVTPVRPPAGWPDRVPDDDFTTYRAACRDLLDPDQFAVVDDYFRASVATARTAAVNMLTAGPVSENTLAPWLQERWQTSETMAQYITFIRAAQVAFFHHRHYLKVDLDQLIGTATTMPRRALRNPHIWALLHAYPEPYRAAICALAAAGVAADLIRHTTLDGYQPGQATVTLPDTTTVAIEDAACIYLSAQWHLRTGEGAQPGDVLFPARNGQPLSASAVVQAVNDARRELGVAVAPARADRKTVTGDRWASRWGISINEIR